MIPDLSVLISSLQSNEESQWNKNQVYICNYGRRHKVCRIRRWCDPGTQPIANRQLMTADC
jgi:hypothetical protein